MNILQGPLPLASASLPILKIGDRSCPNIVLAPIFGAITLEKGVFKA
jgi:hypothetical protein